MKREACFALVLGSLIVSWLAQSLSAQSVALPETYSFSATSSIFGPETTMKVNRNGSREVVERTQAAKPGAWNEVHDRLLYDFQAHKIYTLDLLASRCTVQEYGSDHAPMFDPIGTGREMAEGFAKASPKVLARENINGIATKLVEMPLPEGAGVYRMWLEEKLNFIVRWEVAMKGEPKRVQLELRQLSYAPSPPALFAPPTGCVRIGGVSTAEGGHAEVDIEANIPAQTHEFGANPRTSGAQPEAPVVTPVERKAAPTATRVTEVRFHLVPASYSGACPGHVQLVGEITTTGPGTVWYQFLAGAVSSSPEGTLVFDAAGTKTVIVEGTFRTAPRVPHASLLAAMQSEDGKHGPRTVTSGPVNYDITCVGQTPAAPVRK